MPSRETAGRSDQVEQLRSGCASEVERRFLDLLCERELLLPDEVHPQPPGLGSRPDFVFHLPSGPVAVFIDSEDSASEPGRDVTAEDELFDAGWMVVRFGDETFWREQLENHAEVFGKGRSA